MQLRRKTSIWTAVFLCFCLCFCSVTASAAKKEDAVPYPEVLQITISRETKTLEDGRTCEVALPVTKLENVNQDLLNAQSVLLADLLTHVSGKQTLEIEATYRISGTCWAGFLLTGRVLDMTEENKNGGDSETTMYLNYAVLTYNMETGQALTLADVFPEDSPAWEQIGTLMCEHIMAYYSHLEKNTDGLDALCTYEYLSQQPFLPSAGRLVITTPLEPIVEGKWQLVNVILPYPDFRPFMNEAAYQQTDNSHRSIIAITYDDGPNPSNTPRILSILNDYGASATFFCIGRSLEKAPDVARRELDYGHTVGSHTYKHRYDFQVNGQFLRDDREQCLQLHREWTGLEPELFRAPGGNSDGYLKHQIGWPIILWRFSAGDTGNNNAYQLAERIYNGARNGDIILMHDLYTKTAKGSNMFFSRLAEDGFLFATVDELLYLHGIVPQPNTIYHDAFSEPITELP